MEKTEAEEPLEAKVKNWLNTEGYPLEFRTAHAFSEAAFDAQQGMYTYDPRENCAREIDILASVTAEISSNRWLRVSHVVECKWSMDRPWILFTSKGSIMLASAQTAQAIGSTLGEAITFCMCGDERLEALSLFGMPVRGGFAGHRAFEKNKGGQDVVYNAIQAVVSKAALKADSYDEGIQPGELPWFGGICFPMVVVQGKLFEAYYDNEAAEVKLSPAPHVRLFWRALTSKTHSISVVDVVSESELRPFLKQRRSDINEFIRVAVEAGHRIERAFAERSMDRLELKHAPRGFVGLPKLLAELSSSAKKT